MKRRECHIGWRVLIGLGFLLESTVFAQMSMPLSKENLTEIKFEKIAPTQFEYAEQQINFNVSQSSAALIGVIDPPKTVSKIKFEWKTNYSESASIAEEKTKGGDDFPLRVGLIVKGKAPMVPFFAPKWIKALKEILKQPSDRMLYLVLGSSQAPGARWPSPYSDSIENLAVSGTATNDGWIKVEAEPGSLELVGYWLMADGDDRKLRFESHIRNMKFE
jgi:hypothetical protein